jgi:cysteinyl-tRNA synthetase
MDDDFNTPEAIAVLFELAREINRNRDAHSDKANILAGCLRRLAEPLGLLQADPETYLRALVASGDGASDGMSAGEVEDLIARRISAREKKDWAEADRIRDELDAAGIVLEDGSAGTTWRRG